MHDLLKGLESHKDLKFLHVQCQSLCTMPAKRKPGSKLKVPISDDVYWKLTKAGAHERKSVTEWAAHLLEKGTKHIPLALKKKSSG